MKETNQNKLGFTFIELLIVIAVLAVLAAIFVSTRTFFSLRPDLDNSIEEVVSALELAQSRTLASEGLNQYGVHFDTATVPNQYVLFKGSGYDVRDVASDMVFNIPNTIEIYSISLGGSDEVVFKRVTGLSSQSGSISIRLKNDPAKNGTIYVEESGRVGRAAPSTPPDTRVKDSRHVHSDYSRIIDTVTEKITLTFGGGATQDIIIANNLQGGQVYWEGEIVVDGSTQKIKIHTHRLNNPDTQFCIHRDPRYNDKSLIINISGDTTGDHTIFC